jgi:hypothetical protein
LRLTFSPLVGEIKIYGEETDSPFALKACQRWFLGPTFVEAAAREP